MNKMDSLSSAGQAGATEIEITPAMIQAGRLAFFPNEVVSYQEEDEVLARVYRAMQSTRLGADLRPTR